MPTSRDLTQYPYKSTQRDQVSLISVVGISTGGLPSPTGSVGVPSGITVVTRVSNGCGVSRIGLGLYRYTFAPAPNGAVRAWVELQSATAGTVFDINPVQRNLSTGFANFQCYTASGTFTDPANGDALGFEFVAFSTGNAAGP